MLEKVLILSLFLFGSASGITKQEALDKLAANFDEVGTPILVQDTLPGYNVKRYQVPIFAIDQDSAAVGKTINLYVKDEGLVGESAFLGKRLTVRPKTAFVNALETYIDDQGMMLVSVLLARPADNWALADVFQLNNTTWVRKQILLQKSGSTITHKDVQ